MKHTVTERGFPRVEFTDCYKSQCSMQVSSSAGEDRIWLGVDTDFNKNDCTRMHLNREHVRQLLPLLQQFVDEE